MTKRQLVKVDSNGKLPEAIKDEFNSFLFSRKDKWIELAYCDKRTPKTQAQLGYWFGIVIKYISDATGYTKDEIHIRLKEKAKFYVDKEIDGEKYRYVRSLSTATKDEMMDIITAAKTYAEILNINIPEPN